MIDISIITSVYNTRPEYLKDYIESIMRQTYQNFEVIIVDDGSKSPETIDFLKDIQSKYCEKAVVFFQEKNQGISASRNYALEKARGEYICVIDSDDYYDDYFLEKMIEPVKQDSEIDMVVCSGYTCVDENKNKLETNPTSICDKPYFFFFRMPTGTRLIKRKMLIDNQIKFPVGTVYEDNAFCIAATLYADKLRHVDHYGYINRQHGKSYSHGYRYQTLTADQIPCKYIEKYVYAGDVLNTASPMKRAAAHGAVMSVLITCVCFFCRKSEKEQINAVILCVNDFIEKNIGNRNSGKYIRLWCKYCSYRFAEKMINICYELARKSHCEKGYIFLLHKVLNSFR
ncbi:MAG: glycosyltransferase [Lachnospiraceae bacterium]|nr:glycosyltransferase [Lachnospiraceae bacterium]